jgi:hypothetical protein
MQNPSETALRNALLLDGHMSPALYKQELAEHVAFWEESMRQDKDELLFVVTEYNGEVAMLLLTSGGQRRRNEHARARLRAIWHTEGVYAQNMELMIPMMVRLLAQGELFVMGVKTMR